MRITKADHPTRDGGAGFSTARGSAAAGSRVDLDLLAGPGVLVVLAGSATVDIGGTVHALSTGDVLGHRGAARHPLAIAADLTWVEVAWPGEADEQPQVWRPGTAAFGPAFGIDMASVGHGVSFGRIAPGGQTVPHHHDETEAFVVVSGTGAVIAGNRAHPVGPGDVVRVDPFDDHVLSATGEQELLFVDLYRRDPDAAVRAARESGDLTGRPVFVFSTPPTPNGDLHLGHLSGPYLGADVYRRFQRRNGVEAYHLTGSDDYQSYVVGRARQEGSTPKAVAAHYAAEIRATLELLDVPLDTFYVTSELDGYREGLRDFFSRLVDSGAVRPRRAPALVDAGTGDYLYEGDVHGGCPTCPSTTGGNICEECGEPNLCVDIREPLPNRPEVTIGIAEVTRFSLPLHDFRDAVLDHHRRNRVTPRLQDLARRVFARDELHLPVSHPSSWGVPPAEPVDGEQVIWVWPEMSYGFLHGIAELGRGLGRDWSAARPADDWKIVHFFGYDNSFYHSILYPVLYRLAHSGWSPDIDYHVNEFYLLDGLKFSTSRRHAIWGKEILTPDTVDSVRHFLSLTRGEDRRTNFELSAFRQVNDEVLVGQWQAWLTDLGDRIALRFDGSAPDAGSWTPVQRAFLGRLQQGLERISLYLGATGFALNDATREIDQLVTDTVRFAEHHARIADDPALSDEYRTAIALELAAAGLLAAVADPIMPRFAGQLAERLGLPPLRQWPSVVTLVPPGSVITLADAVFFSPFVVIPESALTGAGAR